VHQHLVITAAEVELGEEACPLELQQLVADQDGELVLYCPGVEGAVVDIELPGLVFLADEQH
jgi:hypothetical protein